MTDYEMEGDRERRTAGAHDLSISGTYTHPHTHKYGGREPHTPYDTITRTVEPTISAFHAHTHIQANTG